MKGSTFSKILLLVAVLDFIHSQLTEDISNSRLYGPFFEEYPPSKCVGGQVCEIQGIAPTTGITRPGQLKRFRVSGCMPHPNEICKLNLHAYYRVIAEFTSTTNYSGNLVIYGEYMLNNDPILRNVSLVEGAAYVLETYISVLPGRNEVERRNFSLLDIFCVSREYSVIPGSDLPWEDNGSRSIRIHHDHVANRQAEG